MKTIYDPVALGLDVIRGMGSNEYLVRCPYHKDSHPSAEYNIEKGLFYCFGCHTSKTAKQLAADLEGALQPMGRATLERLSALDDREWMNLMRNPLAIDNEYLAGRRVTNEQVRRFDIRANEDGIIIPIKDVFDRVTGLQIRHYSLKPKYMIYGERQLVWPMNFLVAHPPQIFVTEGIFGALRADRYALGCAAILGSGSIGPAVKVLKMMRSRVYGVFDNDFAGYLAAGKFTLHDIPVIIQEGEPDEWTHEEWLHVADHAEELKIMDVLEVIEKSGAGFKLENQLRQYWRKL